MKNKLTISSVLIAGLLTVCGPIFVRHGGVEYDSQHPITIKGTVSEFVWASPLADEARFGDVIGVPATNGGLKTLPNSTDNNDNK